MVCARESRGKNENFMTGFGRSFLLQYISTTGQPRDSWLAFSKTVATSCNASFGKVKLKPFMWFGWMAENPV